MNNLPEIRDIHLPDGVSFFPLASGWWFLLIILIVLFLVIFTVLWVIRRSRKYFAERTLQTIDTNSPVLAAIEISELLKRICVLKYKDASTLYGQDWIDFLNNHTKKHLSADAAALLMFAPFMKSDDLQYMPEEAAEIKAFAKEWIGANL